MRSISNGFAQLKWNDLVDVEIRRIDIQSPSRNTLFAQDKKKKVQEHVEFLYLVKVEVRRQTRGREALKIKFAKCNECIYFLKGLSIF